MLESAEFARLSELAKGVIARGEGDPVREFFETAQGGTVYDSLAALQKAGVPSKDVRKLGPYFFKKLPSGGVLFTPRGKAFYKGCVIHFEYEEHPKPKVDNDSWGARDVAYPDNLSE